MHNTYEYKIDGYNFSCNKDELNYELKKLNFYYNMNKNSPVMTIIVCDDKNLEKQFTTEILTMLNEFKIFELKDRNDIITFNKSLKNNESLLITNLKEFRIYCDKLYDNNGAEHLWMWMFNFGRDFFFNEYNARIILELDDEEYTNLVLWAKDFQEYCKLKINLNSYYKCRELDGISLDTYLINKNRENPKLVKKL